MPRRMFLWTAVVLSTWETVAENSILQQNGRRFTLAHRMGEGRGEGSWKYNIFSSILPRYRVIRDCRQCSCS
jgi:hypothetical protein